MFLSFTTRSSTWQRAVLCFLFVTTACKATPQEAPGAGTETPQFYTVKAGDDLQAVVNSARLGDTILLENGAVFEGNLWLAAKEGTGFIEIRPVDMDFLPPPDERVNKSHFAAMPKLLSNNTDPAVGTVGAAHHFRFIGLELGVTPGRWHWATINIGTTQEKNLEDFPHDIQFDRVYVHGDPLEGSVRGFALNGKNLEVRNSHISNYKRPALDTQAIAVWNSPGQIRIFNNYLEGAGENIIIGGAPPSILNMVPSDIEIRRNHFRKPLSWRESDPSFEGPAPSVKNLFEIKMGRRIVLDSNILEYTWQHHQIGFAIVLTVRTEDALVPLSVVEDIQISNNIIRHTGCGVNMLGVDDWNKGAGLGKTQRINIRNNLFYDIGNSWGCGGRLFQMLDFTEEVTIDHNTIYRNGGSIFVAAGNPHKKFRFINNIISYGDYGVVGDGIPNGDKVLAFYYPGAEIRNNIITDRQPNLNPPGNFFIKNYDEVPFQDVAALDFRLAANSPYRKKGADGADVGVDMDQLMESTAGVVSGIPYSRVPDEQKRLSNRRPVRKQNK